MRPTRDVKVILGIKKDETIRYAIRQGHIRAPRLIGGIYLWRDSEIRALARHLGLPMPALDRKAIG